jgi:hypothetical protein
VDKTAKQLVVRRRDNGYHITKLKRIKGSYRSRWSWGESREGHDRHPHAGRG